MLGQMLRILHFPTEKYKDRRSSIGLEAMIGSTMCIIFIWMVILLEEILISTIPTGERSPRTEMADGFVCWINSMGNVYQYLDRSNAANFYGHLTR